MTCSCLATKEAVVSARKNIQISACMPVNIPRELDGSSRCKEHMKEDDLRRNCGCLKTSDKLKELLKCFPTAPPPPPTPVTPPAVKFENTCVSAHCTGFHQAVPQVIPPQYLELLAKKQGEPPSDAKSHKVSRSCQLLTNLVQLLQLWVTATALAIYYIIYCYMQMVYYTLSSVMFFHNADGAMKVTIAVVTVTGLVVGFNLILRLERMLGINWYGV